MLPAVRGHDLSWGGAQRGADEKVMIGLTAFTGITGVAGGVGLMARPDGSLVQMPPSALAPLMGHSPFADFLFPGLVLAAIVGGGMLAAATLLFQRRSYTLEMTIAAGVALVIFELVECAAIGFVPLQAVAGAVGLLVLGLATRRRLATS